MSITVKEILSLPVFQDAKYVAGREGDQKHVRWISMLELLGEAKQLEPEELLLTTAFELSDNGSMKHNLIPTLAEQGLSGIIIQTGYYLEEIPEEILKEGDRCHFPIIEIPRNLSFSEITRYVHKYILNKQFEKIQFSEELYKTFTDIALKNEGIKSMCNVVNNLIGGKIQIVDTSMNILCDIINKEHPVDVPDEFIQEVIYQLKDDFDSGVVLSKSLQTNACHVLVAPIKAKDHVYGYITVAKIEQMNEFEEIAIHHTSTMCALEFLKLSSLEEKEKKMRADYLELLLTGSYKDDITVYSKGEALGYPIGTHDTCVAILGIDGFHEILNGEKLEAQLLQTVQKLMQGYGLQHLSKLFSGQLVLLITNQYPHRVHITDTLEKIAAHLHTKLGITLSIGIGHYYRNHAHYKQSYKEAQESLFIIQTAWKKDKCLHYRDLGFYRLLLPLFEHPELMADYYKQVLGDLIQQPELIDTLEVYLTNIQKINDVADKLFIHRHTLKYRLKKIEEITQKRLLHFQERMELELALIIYLMLHPRNEASKK